MSKEIVVRFARLDDLDFAYQDGYIPAKVLKPKIEAQVALNPDRIEDVVIAEWNGKRVGYVRLEYLWSIVPYISLIRVLPEYRRQGVGKALLRFIETFLREARVTRHSTVHRRLTNQNRKRGIGMWGLKNVGSSLALMTGSVRCFSAKVFDRLKYALKRSITAAHLHIAIRLLFFIYRGVNI